MQLLRKKARKRKRAKRRKKNAIFAPIVIRAGIPSNRNESQDFDGLTSIQTPRFNGGWHEVDATGLTYDAKTGVVAGTVTVWLHSDGWVPYGGGKTYNAPGLEQKFTIRANLEGNVLSGIYSSSGILGSKEGTLQDAVVVCYTALTRSIC